MILSTGSWKNFKQVVVFKECALFHQRRIHATQETICPLLQLVWTLVKFTRTNGANHRVLLINHYWYIFTNIPELSLIVMSKPHFPCFVSCFSWDTNFLKRSFWKKCFLRLRKWHSVFSNKTRLSMPGCHLGGQSACMLVSQCIYFGHSWVQSYNTVQDSTHVHVSKCRNFKISISFPINKCHDFFLKN